MYSTHCLIFLVMGSFAKTCHRELPISEERPYYIPDARQLEESSDLYTPCTTEDTDEIITRSGIIASKFRWDVIRFYIDDVSFTANDRKRIYQAAYEIYSSVPSCCLDIRFFKKGYNAYGDYVNISRRHGPGCAFNGKWVNNTGVGKRGGQQQLSLGKGCMTTGQIIHEMYHALGFKHEQARWDRDDYIEVHWQNIEEDKKPQFQKLPKWKYSSFGMPYDPRSVMHYSDTTFVKTGEPNLKTFTVKDGTSTTPLHIYQDSDKARLMLMYCTCEA